MDMTYEMKTGRLNLTHGQPVMCWDDCWSHHRSIKFYDAINKRTFHSDGTVGGPRYGNYLPIDNPPEWMIEASKTLVIESTKTL